MQGRKAGWMGGVAVLAFAASAFMVTGQAVAAEDAGIEHAIEHATLEHSDRPLPNLASSSFLVVDQETGEVLLSHNTDAVVPIASLSKLMTALITVHAGLPLDEVIEVTEDDVDTIKGTGSRLRVGTKLSREDLLKLALMASENRAAHALGRSYPGGLSAFVAAMNAKARELNMNGTHFIEPTGLSSSNVSTAEDLAKLVRAAHTYPLIREYTTLASYEVNVRGRRTKFVNTNALVRAGEWDIGLSKTGYISEAGRCLVMQAKLAARNVIIVLLDSVGKYTRIADATRIRAWLDPEYNAPRLQAARISKKVKLSSRAKLKVAAKPKPKAKAKATRVRAKIKASPR